MKIWWLISKIKSNIGINMRLIEILFKYPTILKIKPTAWFRVSLKT